MEFDQIVKWRQEDEEDEEDEEEEASLQAVHCDEGAFIWNLHKRLQTRRATLKRCDRDQRTALATQPNPCFIDQPQIRITDFFLSAVTFGVDLTVFSACLGRSGSLTDQLQTTSRGSLITVCVKGAETKRVPTLLEGAGSLA